MSDVIGLFHTLRTYALVLLGVCAVLFVLLGLARLATKGRRNRAIAVRHEALRIDREIASLAVRTEDFDQSDSPPGPRTGNGWQSAARYGSDLG